MRSILVPALIVSLTSSALASPPAWLGTWGTCDFGSPADFSPTAVATAPDGSVYVVDEPDGRVLHFDATGSPLGGWGTSGSGPGQLHNPQGIAVAPNGDVYVADTFNHRVAHFDAAGGWLGEWGTLGTGDGQFHTPRGIVVRPDGHVIVGDATSHLQEFSADGGLVRSWRLDPNDFSMHTIYGLARSGGGDYFVATTPPTIYHHSASGELLAKWELSGTPGSLLNPFGIACTSDGRVLVSDISLDGSVVAEFSESGSPLQTWGGRGVSPGRFQRAAGIAVGPAGEFYVGDLGNCRVQKFGAGAVPVKRSTWGAIKSRYR